MTQEEKQVLLKDLSARLPYGVRIKAYGDNTSVLTGEHYDLLCTLDNIESLPFLRPMSSMTLEELEEYRKFGDHVRDAECKIHIANFNQIDWLNKKHFDYRGLIDKGLAIEVTESNNPYKE